MLKIHKSHSKSKLLIIPITSICIVAGLLGFYYLTYTPELSHAESVTYEKTIDDIIYMQEMTPEICKSMELEKQYQLTDIRKNFDGTQPKYWISRLKDNNCWMTQNLDLDIPAEGLSAKDTDTLADWNSTTNPTYAPVATQTEPTPKGFNDEGYTDIASWDPGIKYCNSTSVTCMQASENGGHDLQGNYYSWLTATAGQGANLTKRNEYVQNSSICPKNWKLPEAGIVGASFSVWRPLSEPGTPAYLFELYGWSWNKGYYANEAPSGSYALTHAPIYLTHTGFVQGGVLENVGVESAYWSSAVYSVTQALMFGGSINNVVVPNHSTPRSRGFTIRCVARNDITNSNISITINPVIDLDVADEVKVEKSETNPSTANLDVKVSSNQKYSVGISAVNPNLISATSEVKILAKSGLLNTAENGWGIKLKDDTNYTALTTSLQTFYTASGAEIKTIPFTIGISTALDIPNGEYSTEITVTATQN